MADRVASASSPVPEIASQLRRAIYLLNSDGGYADAMRMLKRLAGMDTSGDDLLDRAGSMTLAEASAGQDREFTVPASSPVNKEPAPMTVAEMHLINAANVLRKVESDFRTHSGSGVHCTCREDITAQGLSAVGASIECALKYLAASSSPVVRK